MCGIAGIFDTRERRAIDRSLLNAMTDVIAHRGPDGDGTHVEPGVGLGHRRLSIIDLAGGRQPMGNADGSVVVVYNGEIYNFQALRRELSDAGYQFATRSDTEVIVHGWQEWGPACVERFNGMFAFALWDRNREALFLCRDRLGIKPLHYGVLPDGHLVFGSELKSLYLHPGLSREIDPHAVEDYFTYGYVPEPRTILKQLKKLPPGESLLIERGKPVPSPTAYWDVPFPSLGAMDDAEACEELVARLSDAVERRLISDVPLGAFLSGGVDSSAVVAMMSELSSSPVKTCNIAFDADAFDESEHASLVARHCKTDHRTEKVAVDDFDLLDRLADLYDEPYADSSAIPTYRVCELAKKDVTVALSGDGGDEAIAGYRRYQRHLSEERSRSGVPGVIRRPVFGALGSIYPRMRWAPRFLRARSTLQMLGRDGVEGYAAIQSVLQEDLRQRIYSDGFRRELGGYRGAQVLHDHAHRAPTEDPLSLIQYLDMKTYLVGDILTKVDRASMAHSLEVRVPFLDHELVGWLTGLPRRMKLRDGEGKWVLKRGLGRHLPRDILYRRKQGFAVPLASWFRGPLRARVADAVRSPALLDTGWFEGGVLKKLVDEHVGERQDHSAAIWSILMFEAFLRRVMSGAAAPSAAGSS
ncbi:MAG: XrtA/PEP-CTERM system amidotransferase [Planctomycetota bacterium]|nr:XrtA/PEP-CTERM system amidotransferase [Planctomycetota bacterium]